MGARPAIVGLSDMVNSFCDDGMRKYATNSSQRAAHSEEKPPGSRARCRCFVDKLTLCDNSFQDATCAMPVQLALPAFSDRPGGEFDSTGPVESTITFPLTMTVSIPVVCWRGFVNVAVSVIVSALKMVTSAK